MKKADIIKKIKTIFEETDSSSIGLGECEADCSPIHFSLGDVSCLIEQFYSTECIIVTYVNDVEVDTCVVDYKNVSMDNLIQILGFLEDYKTINE